MRKKLDCGAIDSSQSNSESICSLEERLWTRFQENRKSLDGTEKSITVPSVLQRATIPLWLLAEVKWNGLIEYDFKKLIL